VIDAVSWTKSTNGRSLQLDPDLIDSVSNDNQGNFCDATTKYNGTAPNEDFGTPGGANTQCTLLPPAGKCDDGGTIRDIVKPAAGQLVITEFLANPAPPPPMDTTTDATKEWFEVTNTGATSFDLNDLTVKNPGATGNVVQSPTCIKVAPGGFALFARSADATKNAMLPPPDATFSFSLVDSGANASIQILDGATMLDSVTWTSVTSGKALQLDPDHFNTTDNDTAAPAAGVYCLGATAYGDMTNTGTPKAANAQCP
jgi:hypothetical protein